MIEEKHKILSEENLVASFAFTVLIDVILFYLFSFDINWFIFAIIYFLILFFRSFAKKHNKEYNETKHCMTLYTLRKHIINFHNASMSLVDKGSLKNKKVEIGVILFFIASIDSLRQQHNFDRFVFIATSFNILSELSFNLDIVAKLFRNFYTKPKAKDIKFTSEAILSGYKTIIKFLNGDKEVEKTLAKLVDEWSKDEKLTSKEESILLS